MKRSLNSTEKKRGGVKWDETNLEENERIKQELNPIKINEPKTPYLSPMDTDDELDLEGAGMSPLSLEDEGPSAKRNGTGAGINASAAAAAVAASAGAAGRGSWSDSEKCTAGSSPGSRGSPGAGGGSASGSPGGGWGRRSPRFNDYYKDDSDTADAGSDDAEQAEKRRRFMELRKRHYNMRDALKKVREVVPGAEEDPGAEGDVEDSEPHPRPTPGLGLGLPAAQANGHLPGQGSTGAAANGEDSSS